MKRPITAVALLLMFAHAPTRVSAEPATPLSATAALPVREVTVFKDGHAFVTHAGTMPTDAHGDVLMDYLPSPVLGTFWPYSDDKAVHLTSVTAQQRKVSVERTALTLHDLLEANIGAEVMVTETAAAPGAKDPVLYKARIFSLPQQSGEELEKNSPPGAGPKLPVKGALVVFKTDTGSRVVSLERILDVTFIQPPKSTVAQEEFRNMLSLHLDWKGAAPQKEAKVGLMYLQLGLRWIPSYKVSIDDKGNATVKLQATLINELTDLEDVDVNLVIGSPSFEFKDTADPMGFGQTITQLSQYMRQNGPTGGNFSNTIQMQQVANNYDGGGAPGPARPDIGPEVAGGGKNEDLFLFTVRHVSLKKGQRMVMPVVEMNVPFKDAYTLDIPFTAPTEVFRELQGQIPPELAKLLAAPKVKHNIRLTNTSDFPFTTAPALIEKGGKVLGQGLMTYTAHGATSDLGITTAVDAHVTKTDEEVKRTPNAVNWQGDAYGRIDLAGKISITNFGPKAMEIEVTRNVLGNVDKADANGQAMMVNAFEDLAGAGEMPEWFAHYSWPGWWRHFNGIGRVTWNVKLEPGKSADLHYEWNYYWR